MDEYQKLLASPTKHQLKLFDTDLAGRDSYFIDFPKGDPAMLTSESGHSPLDTNAITHLSSSLKGQQDNYSNGVRTHVDFKPSNSTREKMVSIDADTIHEGGKEYVAHESGRVLTWPQDVPTTTGRFEASFGKDGRLLSYAAGPDERHLTDRTQDCKDK